MLLTTVWSFLVSRRNRGLHAFTLAPKADAFPECGFSLKTGGMDVAAARDEVAGFLDGLHLRAGSVKYDFLNGINCVYLTYLV